MGAFERHGGPAIRTAVSILSPTERADLQEIGQVNEYEGYVLTNEFLNPDESQIKLAGELNEVRMLISDDDQMCSALFINRPEPGDTTPRPLLLVANGFLASVADTDGKYRAYHLAREFPEHQIIVYDQYGHGFSSPYSAEQRWAMSTGSMEDVGHQQFSGIRNFSAENLAPITRTDATATSYGSRDMLDVIVASHKTDFPIDKVVLKELPGAEGGRRFNIHASYFGYEFLRGTYLSAGSEWWDEHKRAFESFIRGYSGKDLPPAPDSFFKNDPEMRKANFYNSILGHGNGLEVLKHIVRSGVVVVRSSAEKGHIDRAAVAAAQRQEMLWEEGKTWGQVIMQHESHDGTDFAPRARISAALTRLGLDYAQDLMVLKHSYPTTMSRIQHRTILLPREMQF